MRGRTVFLFLIALLLAGGTAFLVRSSLTQRSTVAAAPAPAPAPAPQKSILVASVAISRGQILKPGDLAWRPWPDAAIARDFIVAGAPPEKTFAGWVAREPFVAGEPIVKAKIVAPGDHGFLAAVLRPGMRAVSVAVDQTSDVSGFILPGDRIDLLTNLSLAEGANSNGYQRKAAQTVLRDARVVAIDQRLDSKDGQAVVARTVTLEVTPKQSEMVALAADMGKLSLSLRSLDATPQDKFALLSAADPTARVSPDPSVDSIDGDGSASVTLDSEVSPLVPRPLIFYHNYYDGKVTILRGNGGSGTSGGSQPGG
ncbi:MAG TPA: Flp pilus assembly protein CpaB [Stellaceae bacterium]|nr:Flp pilus assembly protein CpaB [Stellaceae bacterium]